MEKLKKQIIEIVKTLSEESVSPLPDAVYRFVVIGGGLSGVEFIACLREAIDRACAQYRVPREGITVELLEKGDRLISECAPGVAHLVQRRLESKGIRVRFRQEVTRVENNRLYMGTETLEANTILCCTGSKPDLRLDLKGLGNIDRGVPVNVHLQSTSTPWVFGVGDNICLQFPGFSGINLKRASYALDQGKLIARNIQRHIVGRPMLRYRIGEQPVGIILGKKDGVIAYKGWKFSGAWAGWLKKYREMHYF